MKKVLLAIMCLLTLVCLCACKHDVYTVMNDIMSDDHAEIDIEIKTTKGSEYILTSTINVKNEGEKNTVAYELSQFTSISPNEIPDSYITTKKGSVEMENGEVTSQKGDAVSDIDFAKVMKLHYQFKDEYFANVKNENGVFTADVLSVKQFTGDVNFNAHDMKVNFAYEGKDMSNMVLIVSYVDGNGVSVVMTYTIK